MPILRGTPSTIAGVLGGRGYRFIQQWLLRDNFTTDRAAGSVNGTAAEPGPGVRTVTDTENKLSISGGAAVFAGGKAVPAWGDPGFVYGTTVVVRSPGLALYATYFSSAGVGPRPGFGNSATSSAPPVWQSMYGLNTATLFVVGEIGAYEVVVYTPTVGEIIESVQILRSVGLFPFRKKNEKWILDYVGSVNSAGALYPIIPNQSSSGAINVVKVAQLSWLPAPLTSDGFGTAGALATSDGLGHAEGIAGGIGSGGGGKTWTGATWTAAAGKASNTPGTGAELVVNGDMETGDPPTGWVAYGTCTLSSDAVVYNSGSKSILVSVTGTGTLCGIVRSVTISFPGWHEISCYVRGVDVSASTFYLNFGIDLAAAAVSNGSWVKLSAIKYLTSNGNINLYLYGSDNSGNSWNIDDVSVLPLTLSTLFSSTTHSTADVLATVAVTLTAGTQAGLVVNLDSAGTPANFVIAYHDGTNCKLEKCVAGVYTTVITAAATYSAGAELRVIKDGTAYRLYYNNALVGTGTISDAGIVSNLSHGLFSTYSANTLDNLTIYARGTAGEYDAPLNEVANG